MMKIQTKPNHTDPNSILTIADDLQLSVGSSEGSSKKNLSDKYNTIQHTAVHTLYSPLIFHYIHIPLVIHYIHWNRH